VYGVLVSAMSFVALPLLSPFADRRPKRRLMVTGLLGFGVATGAMALFAWRGHYRLEVVVAIEAITVLAGALVMPATNSIVTELVPPAGLSRALGLQQTAQASGRLVGPALAAALLARRLPRPGHGAAPQARGRWADEVRVGLRVNWAIPIERGWVICNFIGAVFMVPCVAMLAPLKVQSLGLSAAWLGGCEAGMSLGLLVGSLGPAAWWARAHGRFGARVGGAALTGLALALAGLTGDARVLVACFAVVGLCAATTSLVGKTHRMLARPLAYRARMSAAAIMTIQVSQTLGPAIAGIALTHWSVRVVYVVFGLLSAASALGFFLVPGFRAFMAMEHAEVDGWYGKRYPGAFEALRAP
jgi:MFS family permease